MHRAYVEAGSDVIHANTFGANPIRLARAGLGGALRGDQHGRGPRWPAPPAPRFVLGRHRPDRRVPAPGRHAATRTRGGEAFSRQAPRAARRRRRRPPPRDHDRPARGADRAGGGRCAGPGGPGPRLAHLRTEEARLLHRHGRPARRRARALAEAGAAAVGANCTLASADMARLAREALGARRPARPCSRTPGSREADGGGLRYEQTREEFAADMAAICWRAPRRDGARRRAGRLLRHRSAASSRRCVAWRGRARRPGRPSDRADGSADRRLAADRVSTGRGLRFLGYPEGAHAAARVSDAHRQRSSTEARRLDSRARRLRALPPRTPRTLGLPAAAAAPSVRVGGRLVARPGDHRADAWRSRSATAWPRATRPGAAPGRRSAAPRPRRRRTRSRRAILGGLGPAHVRRRAATGFAGCRVSPGYGDWPLAAQERLFARLPHDAIGVRAPPLDADGAAQVGHLRPLARRRRPAGRATSPAARAVPHPNCPATRGP